MTKKDDTKPKGDLPDLEILKKVEELEQKNIEIQKELDEREKKELRALADLQNVRRRAEEERVRLPQLGAEKLLISLLPTLDHLELALKNTPEEKTEWIKGVESIFSGCFAALSEMNVQKIDQTGVPIDTTIHEVLAVDPNGKEGTVAEVLQSGYKMGDIVVRPAKVKAGGGQG